MHHLRLDQRLQLRVQDGVIQEAASQTARASDLLKLAFSRDHRVRIRRGPGFLVGMSMGEIYFREAVPDDAGPLAALIKELAAYDGNAADVHFSPQQLRGALSGAAPRLRAILAIDGNRPIGFITYTIDYAIWAASDVLRIDDLFFSADYRGRGLGKRLMTEIARRAVAGGMVARWEVMPQNIQAQAFYRGLGADLRDKIVARWDGAAMIALLGRGESTGAV